MVAFAEPTRVNCQDLAKGLEVSTLRRVCCAFCEVSAFAGAHSPVRSFARLLSRFDNRSILQ
jgi:hypothetical protein